MESFEESTAQVTESSLQPVNLFCDGYSPENTDSIVDEKLATFLRIRPIEGVSLESTPFSVIDSNHLSVEIEEKVSVYGTKKPKHDRLKVSSFNHIFDSSASQSSVFNKCCLPLVNDLLDGTNALLFCFGTTSSGKSYTMRGPPDDPTRDPGLIPLSLKKIFSSRQFLNEPIIGKTKFSDILILDEEQQILEKQFKESLLSSACCRSVCAFPSDKNGTNFNEDGYQYICYLSYFEIYNGLVYDLLLPSSGSRGSPLTMFLDDKQRYFVRDLKSVMVSSLTEALQIYTYGWTNLQRNIQETGLNKNSSRSHSFLCISLIRFREDEGQLLESQVSHLTLGDLAGSERQNKTHSEGLRMKEGGNINVSLMHLKECFNQTKLSQKNPNRNFVIPFRNSSLTKFFQPYLTGTGRVWMIVNINPSPNLLGETVGTLDLGETASHISINSTHQLKLEESSRRMTQVWLQSSQRWSSFAGKYKNPQIIIESTREEGDYCEMLQPGADLFSEREEQIRKDVIAQFEEILAETMADHEKDLQIIKETWEKKMEARLALSDKRHQSNIKNLETRLEEYQTKNVNLQSRIEELTNELFKANEKIVQLDQSTVAATTSENEMQTSLIQKSTTDTTVQTDIEDLVPLPIIDSVSIDVQTAPLVIVDTEVQTENQIVLLGEFKALQDAHQDLLIRCSTLVEPSPPPILVVTSDNETQTDTIEQLELVSEFIGEVTSEVINEVINEMTTEVVNQVTNELKVEVTSVETQTEQIVISTHESETQTEIELVPLKDHEIPKETVSEFEIEEDDVPISPKRSRMTVGSACPAGLKSTRKSLRGLDKAVSVKKSREITFDSNYFPASVSDLTKRKRKEEAADSPSTEIANEYLKMMLANAPQCPPSTTKKSVKRSAKKPPRKSTRTAMKPEPEVSVEEEDHEDDGDVEEDELASLLISTKKGKKKSKEDTPSIKIPVKRKKIPTNNELLEVSISSHIEDEPSNEPTIKGGRVLRPRRKIKF